MLNEIPKSSGYFESFDGTKIYFESRGHGEPIVFVYGIACLMNHWHHQMSYLSSSYQVISFDLRGHHKSSLPVEGKNLNISSVALDIKSLLDHLQLQKAHFVGHSFGAPVIFSFYDQFPEKVLSMALINGFSQNPIRGMFGLDVVEHIYSVIKINYEKNRELWDNIWKMSVTNPLAIWFSGLLGGFNLKLTQFKDIEVYAKGVSQVPLSVFLPLFESLMSFSGDQILEKISVPTLIISGEKDAVTPVKFQQQIHEKIKGSEFVVVPYGSHCTQLDFPDYVNLKLEAHLKSISN